MSFSDIIQGLKSDLKPEHSDFKITLCMCGLLAVSTLLSLYFSFFIWITLAICFVYVLGAHGGRAMYILPFMLPLSYVFRASPESSMLIGYVCFAIVAVLGVKFLTSVLKKQKKFEIMPTVLCTVLLLCFCYPFGFNDIGRIANFITGALLLYLVYIYRKDISPKEIFLLFFAGLAVSFCFGFLAQGAPRADLVFFYDFRYAGLYNDPNTFAAEAVMCLAVLLIFKINNKMKFVFYPVLTFLIICVVLTCSKAGYLSLAFVMLLYFAIFIIKTFKDNDKKGEAFKKIVLHAAALVCIAAVVGIIFKYSIDTTFGRFIHNDELGGIDEGSVEDIFNVVTTGRFGMWKTYVKTVFGDIKHALFGFGVEAPFIGTVGSTHGMAPHNSYIDALYFIGLFGYLVIFTWALILFIPLIKQKRVNWWNIVGVAALAVCIASLSTFSSKLAMYLLIILPTLTYRPAAMNKDRRDDLDAAKQERKRLDRKKGEKILSVVIPVYNTEKYLRNCVESVLTALEGLEAEYEIILVNDGSPDKCPAICDELAGRHKHIKVIHQKNQGVCAARNAGIRKADSEYITFIDSDDFVNKNLRAALAFIKDAGADVIACPFEKNGEIWGMRGSRNFTSLCSADKSGLIQGDKTNCCYSKFVRKNFIEAHELFLKDGCMAEDLEWFVRVVLAADSWITHDLPFYVYNVNEGSVTKNVSLKRVKDSLVNCKRVFEEIDKSALDAMDREQIKEYLAKHVYANFQYWRSYTKEQREELVKILRSNKGLFIYPARFDAKVIYWFYNLFGVKCTLRFVGVLKK